MSRGRPHGRGRTALRIPVREECTGSQFPFRRVDGSPYGLLHGSRRRCGSVVPATRSHWRRPSVQETAAQERAYRAKAISPRNLLALVIGSTVIRDGHLIDTKARVTEYLRRHLRLDPEIVRAESETIDDLAPEHLVPCFHIG